MAPSDISGNGREPSSMPKLRVASFSISIDGFGAGPDQSSENPLGLGALGSTPGPSRPGCCGGRC